MAFPDVVYTNNETAGSGLVSNAAEAGLSVAGLSTIAQLQSVVANLLKAAPNTIVAPAGDVGSGTFGSTISPADTGTYGFPTTLLVNTTNANIATTTGVLVVSGGTSGQHLILKNPAASTRYNWLIGSNVLSSADLLQFVPSSAADGSTYSTAAATLTRAGVFTTTTVVAALTGNVTGNVTGSSGSTTGNALTATTLQTARDINGVSFNGSANITVTAAAGTLTGTTLAATVVTSSLTSVGVIATKLSIGSSGLGSLALDVLSVGAGTAATFSTANTTSGNTMVNIQFANSITGAATALQMSGTTSTALIAQLNQGGAGDVYHSTITSGAGDPYTYYQINGVTDWTVGIDNSDSDSFKISNGTPGTNTWFKITTAGAVTMAGTLGVTGASTFSSTLDNTGTVTVGAASAANLIVAGGGAVMATNATAGFLFLTSCAGTPNGTPASIPSGTIATFYDATNDRIYFYRGAWRSVAVT